VSWTKTYAGPEPIRVNKWLAQEGVCSRREAEALIGEGLVSIDGARVDDPGRKLAPGQRLRVADSGLPAPITAVLNKPPGYVSAQPQAGQAPAARLLTRANLLSAAAIVPTKTTSLAPLGRLDQDSRGLLLLSQDGVLAKAVIGADSALDKEYVVCVDGDISEAKLGKLRRGLVLDGKALKPAEVALDGSQRLRFILREGRKRQIRRMCELVGLQVTDLMRVRIGPLKLGPLAEGKWRPLTAAEREALLRAARIGP
jgi:23S rRNA pseudouridine2604 synthase